MSLDKKKYNEIISICEPTSNTPLVQYERIISEIDYNLLKVVLVNVAALDYSFIYSRGAKQEKRPCYGLHSIKFSLSQSKYYSVIIDMDEFQLAPIDVGFLINYISLKSKNNVIVALNGYSPNRSIVEKTIFSIKKINPNINVVIGGRLVSIELNPIDRLVSEKESIISYNFTENPANIYAIIGEAEKCFPLFINLLDKGEHDNLTNVEYKSQKEYKSAKHFEIISNDNFEYYDNFTPPTYKATMGDGNQYYVMLSSRSCNFNCSFCAAKYFPQRCYSINFLKQKLLLLLKSSFNKINIDFIDDNVLSSVHRSKEIIDMMYVLNTTGNSIKWRALARADVIIKLSEIGYIKKAALAGLEEVAIGFETVTDRLLVQMNKGTTFEISDKAVNLLNESNIRAKLFVMIGIESETEKELESTLTYVNNKMSNNVRSSVFIKSTYAGTLDHKRLLSKGWTFWDLQLYTEATYRGAELINYVDKLKIKFSDMTLGQINSKLIQFNDNMQK